VTDIAAAYLAETRSRFGKTKEGVERAIAQVDDAAFFTTLGAEDNSIAIIMKHMAGNLRSRFTDFLASDGEKPDRNRDTEFEIGAADTRASIEAAWQAGWRTLFEVLDGLRPEDVSRTVHIRGEPHSVLQALERQQTHHAYHAGQVVLLAKHHAGQAWRTLSIPRKGSAAFNESMLSRRQT
jgi:hypothetical protein